MKYPLIRHKPLRNESGVSLLEYALLVALIAVIAIVAVRTLGNMVTYFIWGIQTGGLIG